jgi:hypothetical protein
VPFRGLLRPLRPLRPQRPPSSWYCEVICTARRCGCCVPEYDSSAFRATSQFCLECMAVHFPLLDEVWSLPVGGRPGAEAERPKSPQRPVGGGGVGGHAEATPVTLFSRWLRAVRARPDPEPVVPSLPGVLLFFCSRFSQVQMMGSCRCDSLRYFSTPGSFSRLYLPVCVRARSFVECPRRCPL